MSNPDKPFVVQHSVPAGVVATRWWWVRHAPVREDGGCIYGQKDLGCDTSDRVVFEAVGKILPRDAVWFASNLKRTHQTADAIWGRGISQAADNAARGGIGRAASRRMAGVEPGRFLCEPADRSRQLLVCADRRSGAGRREFHGSLQSPWRMAERSRRRSALRWATSRRGDSRSPSTIAR
jgi:hypothetical protein